MAFYNGGLIRIHMNTLIQPQSILWTKRNLSGHQIWGLVGPLYSRLFFRFPVKRPVLVASRSTFERGGGSIFCVCVVCRWFRGNWAKELPYGSHFGWSLGSDVLKLKFYLFNHRSIIHRPCMTSINPVTAVYSEQTRELTVVCEM